MIPIKSSKAATEVFEAEFEAAWQHGGLWISVWHPFLSGRLSRLEAKIGLFERMREKGDVWFATLAEIADHTNSVIESDQWQPRIDKLPFDESPIPELEKMP